MQVSTEWQAPTLVGSPVSTSGWEDSPHVLPDGKQLYFTYFRADPILFKTSGVLAVSGPTRPGWPVEYPFNELGADIYVTNVVNGVWQTPQPVGTAINFKEEHEGNQWVSADGKRILFNNGDGSTKRPRGIYYSEKAKGVWTEAIPAVDKGFPFELDDANPHLTTDEQTLFFESSRPGCQGGADIWMSRKVSGVWQQPVCLGSSVNTPLTEGSPFSLDGKTLYFDDKGAGNIFRSVRQADGTWSKRESVVQGTVGDPSVTLNGDLYFTAGGAVRDVDGNITGYKADLMVARKR